MTLPKPLIHFDAMQRSDAAFVKGLNNLPIVQKMEIMHDLNGEYAGLGDFPRDFPAAYVAARLMLMYEWHRQQVVVVGPRMQEAFAHTSLAHVPGEMIQLPHPCLYIATPESKDLLLWGGERTQWHPVAGCYIAKEPSADVLLVYAWGGPNEKSLDPLDDASLWFRIDLNRIKSGNFESEFSESIEPYTDMTVETVNRESRRIDGLGTKHRSLEDALNVIFESPDGEASDKGMEIGNRGQSSEHVEQVKITGRKVMRIVVNTILYMNSSNAEITDPTTNDNERARLIADLKRLKNPRKSKGRSLQKRIDNLSKSRIVWVGPTIEQAEPGGENDLTTRRVAGHVRRGHWHTFLVGPRKREGALIPKEERKHTLKWIPPIWVGSLKEAITGPRVYGVKEPE